jgi:DNA-directed RNA polymerase III subunit RPC6
MKAMTFEDQTCWKLRTREDADKLRRLSAEELLLYHHIDQAQAEGIWSKALRARTNFTPQAMNKYLKTLENRDLVQSVMSVKYPNRKMYLLKHLRPSEDMAGGPWQSEGEFDVALIDTVSKIVEKIINKATTIAIPANYNNYDRTAAIAHKKAQVQAQVQDIEETPATKSFRPPKTKPREVLQSEPKYPTALHLRDEVDRLRVIKDKTIQESDMEQLLEMMVLEGRLEKVSGLYYRLAQKVENTDDGMNGFVDAPCGTCPVFDLCQDEGEISARTCVYFGEWLGTESEKIDTLGP